MLRSKTVCTVWLRERQGAEDAAEALAEAGVAQQQGGQGAKQHYAEKTLHQPQGAVEQLGFPFFLGHECAGGLVFVWLKPVSGSLKLCCLQGAG